MTLIAEDLLLVLLDDETGRSPSGLDLTTVLGGALLVELALVGAVEVEDRTSFWNAAKVRVVPGVAVDDQLLADTLTVVGAKERTAQDLVGRLGKGLRDRLTERLAQAGILQRRDTKILGLFPSATWPAVDRRRGQALQRDLVSALVEGNEPDSRTGSLIALLVAVDQAHKVVPHEGLSAREVKARGKTVAEGQWAAKAVKKAIDAATAATIAAATAAATGAAVAGS